VQFSHLYSSALHRELGTDDSTRLFTDARRKDAINQGHLQFCALTECSLRISTFACSNAIGVYNLLSTTFVQPGDFLQFAGQQPEYRLESSGSTASITYIAGDHFPRRDVNWLNVNIPGWRSSTSGTPLAWYPEPDGGAYNFGLFPPPEIGSSEHGYVRLPYVARPSSLSSDTDVPFTFGSTVREDLQPFHQALVHYAAGELEKLRKDWQAVQVQQQLFQSYVTRYAQSRNPKGPRQMKSARNYFTEVKQRRGDPFRPWWWR